MEFFKYYVLLGLSHLAFDLIWRLGIAFILKIVFVKMKFPLGDLILKAAEAYFLVSITTLVAIEATQELSFMVSVGYFLAGGLLLFAGFVYQHKVERKNAFDEFEVDKFFVLRYYPLFDLIAILLFAVSFFVPNVSVNHITIVFLEYIALALDVKILGWLIRGAGIIFVIHLLVELKTILLNLIRRSGIYQI